MIDGSMRTLMERHSRAISDGRLPRRPHAPLQVSGYSRSTTNVKRMIFRPGAGDDKNGDTGRDFRLKHHPTAKGTGTMDEGTTAEEPPSTEASTSESSDFGASNSILPTTEAPTTSQSSSVQDPSVDSPGGTSSPAPFQTASSSQPTSNSTTLITSPQSTPSATVSDSSLPFSNSMPLTIFPGSSTSPIVLQSSLSSYIPSSTSALPTMSASLLPVTATSEKIHRSGAIAGGVIGAFVFVCLFILGLLVFLKRRRRNRTPPSAEFREYAARYEAARQGSNDDLPIPPPPFARGNFTDPFIEKIESTQRANTSTYGYAT